MYNDWNSLPDSARIWMYGAYRKLTAEEQSAIRNRLESFCAEWSAHGAKLRCGFSILHDTIIVLSVDEQQAMASGCSIDSSVAIIREIDQSYDLDLFNRMRSFVKINDNWNIMTVNEVKSSIEDGVVNAETPMVDPMIQTMGELKKEAVKPLAQTWLAKFLKTPA